MSIFICSSAFEYAIMALQQTTLMNKYPQLPLENIKKIVWDLDNTIWSWVKMHIAAHRAMLNTLVNGAKTLPEQSIIASMQEVYRRAGTLDHTTVVQEMECFQGRSDIDNLSQLAGKAYAEAARANFTLYEGAKEVLEKIKQAGIESYVLTDAPMMKAVVRLSQAGIGDLFTKVFAQKDPILNGDYGQSRIKKYYKGDFEFLEVDHHKPNLNLSELLNISQEEVSESVMTIGDNPEKDMGLAYSNHCYGLLALWGQLTEKEKEALCFMTGGNLDAIKRNANSDQIILPENYNKIILACDIREITDKVLTL